MQMAMSFCAWDLPPKLTLTSVLFGLLCRRLFAPSESPSCGPPIARLKRGSGRGELGFLTTFSPKHIADYLLLLVNTIGGN